VFSKPIVKDLFGGYTLVRLYGDYLPAGYPSSPSAEENSAFQVATFGDNRRPFYVILEPLPDGKFNLVGSYKEGLIGDVPAFVEFLKGPLSHSAAANAGAPQVASQK